jgi:hypothetical protein
MTEDEDEGVAWDAAHNERTPIEAVIVAASNSRTSSAEAALHALGTRVEAVADMDAEAVADLFDAARQDGMAFKNFEAFRQAYDYTYGEGAMGNPMLAANIFAEPREN